MATGGLHNSSWLAGFGGEHHEEKHRAQEALEKAQTQIRDLESHLACQRRYAQLWEVGLLEGLREREEGGAQRGCPVWFVLTWALQLGEAKRTWKRAMEM